MRWWPRPTANCSTFWCTCATARSNQSSTRKYAAFSPHCCTSEPTSTRPRPRPSPPSSAPLSIWQPRPFPSMQVCSYTSRCSWNSSREFWQSTVVPFSTISWSCFARPCLTIRSPRQSASCKRIGRSDTRTKWWSSTAATSTLPTCVTISSRSTPKRPTASPSTPSNRSFSNSCAPASSTWRTWCTTKAWRACLNLSGSTANASKLL